MDWKLVKYKVCDGACCIRSPRFPRTGSRFGPNPNLADVAGADCIYHLNTGESPYGGCKLIKDRHKVELLTDEERAFFESTCLNWPLPFQNADYGRIYSDQERSVIAQEFDPGCCHRWELV